MVFSDIVFPFIHPTTSICTGAHGCATVIHRTHACGSDIRTFAHRMASIGILPITWLALAPTCEFVILSCTHVMLHIGSKQMEFSVIQSCTHLLFHIGAGTQNAAACLVLWPENAVTFPAIYLQDENSVHAAIALHHPPFLLHMLSDNSFLRLAFPSVIRAFGKASQLVICFSTHRLPSKCVNKLPSPACTHKARVDMRISCMCSTLVSPYA